MKTNRKPTYKLAFIATVVAFIVIGLGAFTRLADAGLGCPDWPGCYGHLTWPQSVEDVQQAEKLFPEAPVDHQKTWPEMVHRYLATSLGLLAIFLLVGAVRNKSARQPLKHTVFLLVLVIVQGLFGMWTVTLKLWPQIVTTHLLGGFLTAATLWLLTLRLSGKTWLINSPDKRALRGMYSFTLIATLVLLMQIALGGWTTSNYAAVACPDFPTCQQQWLPEMDFSKGFNVFQHIGPNYLGGLLENESRVAIHMAHRIGSIVASIFVLLVAFRLFKASTHSAVRRMSFILLAAVCLQVGLGISNIVLHFPIAIAVAHNICGALLLLCMITVLHRLYSCQSIKH